MRDTVGVLVIRVVGLAILDDIQLDMLNRASIVIEHSMRDILVRNINQLSTLDKVTTMIDHALNLTRTLWQIERELVAGDEIGATLDRLHGGLRLVRSLDTVQVQLSKLGAQVLKVGQQLCITVILDLNQSEVIRFLRELVHQTTGESLAHLLAVESLHLGEIARLDRIATVLREEHGEGRVGEFLSELVVAARVEVGVAAPRVGVETKEIGLGVGRVFQVALEVVHSVFEDLSHVCGRVTDGDGAFGVLGDVVFHVTLERLWQSVFGSQESTETDVPEGKQEPSLSSAR